MTAIIDYKAGNLTSVKYAFDALGEESAITSDPDTIAAAGRVVFPGVGAAKSAMANLAGMGLVDAVRRAAAEKPFLGICLGMQILFDRSEEDGGVDCLGLVPGKVRRFPAGTPDKIPQIGWNDVERIDSSGKEREYYYFVHSYYAERGEFTAGVTKYAGVEITSMVKKGNILACQFHPEKSGRAGLKMIDDWLKGKECAAC